ncbi:MAG: PEP/pyruvate-binding domain-containing protein [Ilumatobacteraceae bacterium]
MTHLGAPSTVVLDGSGVPPSWVGGKAAALDRLIGWSVPVPPTAVVTTEAYRRVTGTPGVRDLLATIDRDPDAPIDGNRVDAAFGSAEVAPELRTAIEAAARHVGGGHRVAVRSSATVEDLEGSSFAGQYRSVLDVDSCSPDDVMRAVLTVFASLHLPAPRAYRAKRHVSDASIAMAAVLMRMIDARRAGVVFTLDPTSERPMVRIEAVDGLGDDLVAGRRTPTVWRIPRHHPDEIEVPADVPDEVARAMALALVIERRAGMPQDVEWAWDGTDVWIVQARPITALSPIHRSGGDDDPFDDDPASLLDAELTTDGIGEMLPGVMPPLVWELASFVVEDGFRTMLHRLGADVGAAAPARWLIRRSSGRAALDVGRLGRMMADLPGADARVRAAYGLEPSSTGLDTAGRLHVVRLHRRAALARRVAVFDADVAAHAASEIEAHPIDPDRHTTDELLARRTALVALAARSMAAELTVSADAGAIHDGVGALLSRYLPADEAARWTDRVTLPDEIASTWPLASAAIIAGATWVELGLEPPAVTPRAERAVAFEELLVALDGAPRWPEPGLRRRLVRRRLAHLVDGAAAQFGRRERTKAGILAIGGELRRIHLELARRLVVGGVLVDPLDVDLLATAELRRALHEQALPSDVDLDARRHRLERQRTAPPLPTRWRSVPTTGAAPCVGRTRLSGLAASGGRFTGRARRVDGPLDPIAPDEVLVATATDPSWTPVLVRCGALVIERGGPLSHAAILAREFGLPAVFDVAGAVSSLDGHLVQVDGDAGTVDVLDASDVVDTVTPEVSR